MTRGLDPLTNKQKKRLRFEQKLAEAHLAADRGLPNNVEMWQERLQHLETEVEYD